MYADGVHRIFVTGGFIQTLKVMIKVIKDYREKEITTGNRKYGIALRTNIIPAFQEVINTIIKEMSEKEKVSIRKLIEEALNG